jgi:hypothetical protein
MDSKVSLIYDCDPLDCPSVIKIPKGVYPSGVNSIYSATSTIATLKSVPPPESLGRSPTS